jgi:hypothetical protein
MCGCKGKYSESDRSFKTGLTHMHKNMGAAELTIWTPNDRDAGCLMVDINGRRRALYLTAEGVQAAIAEGFILVCDLSK